MSASATGPVPQCHGDLARDASEVSHRLPDFILQITPTNIANYADLYCEAQYYSNGPDPPTSELIVPSPT
eukprot:3750863-Rhodomonas_salina.1